MNDTTITFRGYAGTDVRHRETRDANVASVRVASTPRVRKDGDWVDGPTTWYSVTAWRTLADHLRDSVRKGDPLLVHGRLVRADTWAPEGGAASTTLEVEALVVGHDLNRGISHFIKAKRPESGAAERPGEAGGADLEEGRDGSHGTADPTGDRTGDQVGDQAGDEVAGAGGAGAAEPEHRGRASWAA